MFWFVGLLVALEVSLWGDKKFQRFFAIYARINDKPTYVCLYIKKWENSR